MLLLAGCKPHDFPTHPAKYREYAYVTNSGTDTVTVLDLVNVRTDRVLRVGSRPTGIAANPVRNEIYAVNSASASVSVIDAETLIRRASGDTSPTPAAIRFQ
jgi:YVTN family beta-propeller protein